MFLKANKLLLQKEHQYKKLLWPMQIIPNLRFVHSIKKWMVQKDQINHSNVWHQSQTTVHFSMAVIRNVTTKLWDNQPCSSLNTIFVFHHSDPVTAQPGNETRDVLNVTGPVNLQDTKYGM